MAEDIEGVTGTPEGAATPEDSGYSQILAGEGADPQKTATEGEAPEQEPAEQAEPQTLDPEEVLLFEIDGKEIPIKRKDISTLAQISEREAKLAEKEKSLNKDYTTKTQALAETRKSIETAFGRMPEPQELNALGKLWKSYFSSPQVKATIDGILSGKVSAGTQAQGGESELVGSLREQIQSLEDRLNGFTSSIEERENQKLQADSQRSWDSWVAKKSESGVKISEEIEQKMVPFIMALRRSNPDWESSKVLDEALRHANIDSLEKGAVKSVLKSADEAKKGKLPKITPKSAAKSDKDMSYSELILSGS